jgi:hypothetical protein
MQYYLEGVRREAWCSPITEKNVDMCPNAGRWLTGGMGIAGWRMYQSRPTVELSRCARGSNAENSGNGAAR